MEKSVRTSRVHPRRDACDAAPAVPIAVIGDGKRFQLKLFFTGWLLSFRTLVRKLFSLRASPHQIAVGFALGVFIGIFPTFGLGGLAILALVPLWKFNVPAAVVGTLLGNPLFAGLWIFLACLIAGISPAEIKVPHESLRLILGHYSQIGLRYLLGNFVVSLVVGVASYFCVVRSVRRVITQTRAREAVPRLEQQWPPQ